MSLKRAAFTTATRVAIAALRSTLRAFGDARGTELSARLADAIFPVVAVLTDRGTLKFYCPGETAMSRAARVLTKEPETIAWLQTFRDGDVFWDVGANVGVYSMYAALQRTVRVLAFEPAIANCYALTRNIEINRMDGVVSLFPVAFAGETRLDLLQMVSTKIGSSRHSLEASGIALPTSFRQGAVAYTIAEFVERFEPPFPNHLKIDVDGIEEMILGGAAKTLADPRLRSLLVELDARKPNTLDRMLRLLDRAGMSRVAQAAAPARAAAIHNGLFVRAASSAVTA